MRCTGCRAAAELKMLDERESDPQVHRTISLVRPIGREDNWSMDGLEQLRARSHREIEAHAADLDRTETGRYLLEEATEVLAAMRLWSQSKYRTDQVIKEILQGADAVALNGIAGQLLDFGTPDGRAASESVALIARRPSGELAAVARYALRAL